MAFSWSSSPMCSSTPSSSTGEAPSSGGQREAGGDLRHPGQDLRDCPSLRATCDFAVTASNCLQGRVNNGFPGTAAHGSLRVAIRGLGPQPEGSAEMSLKGRLRNGLATRLLLWTPLALLPVTTEASADTLMDALSKAYSGNPNLTAEQANLRA